MQQNENPLLTVIKLHEFPNAKLISTKLSIPTKLYHTSKFSTNRLLCSTAVDPPDPECSLDFYLPFVRNMTLDIKHFGL